MFNLYGIYVTPPHTTAISAGVDPRGDAPGEATQAAGRQLTPTCSVPVGLLAGVHPLQHMSNTDTSPPDQYGPVAPESVAVPPELSSDGTKLVYLYLQVNGESTLDDLNQSLEMKTISLLPILNTLQSKELVDRQDNCYLPTAA